MLDHPELGEWSAGRAIQLPGSSGRLSKRPFQTWCWAKGVDRCTRLSTNSTTATAESSKGPGLLTIYILEGPLPTEGT